MRRNNEFVLCVCVCVWVSGHVRLAADWLGLVVDLDIPV